MEFEAWKKSAIDRERQRRLLAGYGIGLVTIAGGILTLALSSEPAKADDIPEADVMDVKLETQPEPEPEPEPEPVEPEPEEPTPREQLQRGPVMPTIATPTEIPEDAPTEKEVDLSANPYASGDPYQFAGQGGTARTPAKKVVVAAPVEVKSAAPKGPERMTADTIPPKQLSGGGPAVFPAAAKAAGIEGTVVVKYVVSVEGNPTDVTAVRGPEALRAACEATVKDAKFTPAMRDGKPVAVSRIKRCIFKLNT
jgi:protein TonB